MSLTNPSRTSAITTVPISYVKLLGSRSRRNQNEPLRPYVAPIFSRNLTVRQKTSCTAEKHRDNTS
ncbi:hypothetical protein PILCRDRAFT_822498 [Piloderma croceum F 1598]|uniref:Uncharacterized protein n=1 Tax=Piloderma croceum (strain F 1598) TaxID=765440 RepID=A0A0C3B2C4_PILCF|nr:hypothetical protein PILCRDRAFT_822498 [Piloderma croceum F 1598]